MKHVKRYKRILLSSIVISLVLMIIGRHYYCSTETLSTLHLQEGELFVQINVDTKKDNSFLPRCPISVSGTYDHGIPTKNYEYIMSTFDDLQTKNQSCQTEPCSDVDWSPSDCAPVNDPIALIIPVRGRDHQLQMYLSRIKPFLQMQKIPHTIITVNQTDNEPFNRGALFNMGVHNAPNRYGCFVMSDVDMIPDMYDNMYTCNKTYPKHISPSISKYQYKLVYEKNFGGIVSFTRKHFSEINGFSNRFWGWGGEDDDLYNRVIKKFNAIDRVPMKIGRVTHLAHFRNESGKINKDRFNLLNAKYDYQKDGLNTVRSICKVMKINYYVNRIDVNVHCEKQNKVVIM